MTRVTFIHSSWPSLALRIQLELIVVGLAGVTSTRDARAVYSFVNRQLAVTSAASGDCGGIGSSSVYLISLCLL